jgi:beta-glucosidase
MSSAPSFQQLVDDIVAARTDPTHAAETLYAQLTQDERLWLLDGDISFTKFILDVAKEGYCHRPVLAGAIPRLGIPGIRFTDGPRGVPLGGKGTAFPTTSTRAQAWDPALEEEVVSPSSVLVT